MAKYIEPSDAEREECVRLYAAREQAMLAYNEAKSLLTKEQMIQLDKLRVQYELDREAVIGGIERRDALRAASNAYLLCPHELRTIYVDGERVPERCAKSGRILLGDDQVVEDPHTGEVYLRSALELPSHPIEEEEEESDLHEEDDFFGTDKVEV